MFSSRVPSELEPNRLARAVSARRASGAPFLDLTLSNPTRAGFEYPPDLLASLGDSKALAYEPLPFGLPSARHAIAAEYARTGTAIAADRIVVTASTSEAYSLLFRVLANPGDEVLVPRPSYPLFDHLARLDAVIARPYNLEYHGAWTVDLHGIEAAMTARTRAVLIVHPNNPTGSFVKQRELDAILELCSPDVALIADEVFAEYVLDEPSRAAAGRVLDRPGALAFALGGLSKSVGLPQVKLGWIAAAGPEELVTGALARLEVACDTYLSPSTPVQVAAASLMERGAAVRRQIQARIRANYAAATIRARAFPACELLRAEGGWYGILRVPSFTSEEDLVLALLHEEGVLVHPGYFFDFPGESYLIVSLLTPEADFDEGVVRILRHLDCKLSRP